MTEPTYLTEGRGSWPDEEPFNDDMIQRRGLPKDAFLLLHDLCYHVPSRREIQAYVSRAQAILKKRNDLPQLLVEWERLAHTSGFPEDAQRLMDDMMSAILGLVDPQIPKVRD